MIYIKQTKNLYEFKIVPVWLLSAFNAGVINTTGFLFSGTFVSHISSIGPRVGLSLKFEDVLSALEILVVPICFILGGTVAGHLIRSRQKIFRFPPYYVVQALISFLIALVMVWGESKTLLGMSDYYFEMSVVATLCFICGLMNGLSTFATNGKIRVTHMTGLATDIGLNLVESKEEKKVNITRLSILLSFVLGSFLAVLIYPVLGLNGMLLALIISVLMTGVSFYNWIVFTRHYQSLHQ